MVSIQYHNARDMGSTPTLGTIFPIFITYTTLKYNRSIYGRYNILYYIDINAVVRTPVAALQAYAKTGESGLSAATCADTTSAPPPGAFLGTKLPQLIAIIHHNFNKLTYLY